MDKAVSAPALLALLRDREPGSRTGIWSCCSANEYFILAAQSRGLARRAPVLVEATANQVDHNGGYTRKSPADFLISISAPEQGRCYPFPSPGFQ